MDDDVLDARRHDTWRSGASFTLKAPSLPSIVECRLAFFSPPGPLRCFHGWRRFFVDELWCKGCFNCRNIWKCQDLQYPANLTMGEYAFIGPSVKVYCMAPITLEPFALASQGSHLCAGTHDIEDVHFQLTTKPIVIKRSAWIASEAFVGPGVTVSEGAVLGARAVAFNDLDAWTVYIGNPAKAVKNRKVRFSDN